MSKYTAPAPLTDDEGTTYFDAEDDGTKLYTAEEPDNGDLVLTIWDDEEKRDTIFVVPARDRAQLAMALLPGTPGIKRGTPAQNKAKYQVVVDTHTVFGHPTEDGIDRLLQRLAWHLRNGIPAKVVEPEGGVFTINEVSEGEVPPRMSETRRHFRYHLPTDPAGDWHYHHNFKKIQLEGGIDVEFQRTYKSEWETV